MHNAIQQYHLLETFSTIPTLSFILLKQSYILNVLVMTRIVGHLRPSMDLPVSICNWYKIPDDPDDP